MIQVETRLKQPITGGEGALLHQSAGRLGAGTRRWRHHRRLVKVIPNAKVVGLKAWFAQAEVRRPTVPTFASMKTRQF
jgi:hypothetical protein